MIKYIEKHSRHYRFRLRENGELIQKNFNFDKFGGESYALQAALDYREKVLGHRRNLDFDFLEWLDIFLQKNNAEKLYKEIEFKYKYALTQKNSPGGGIR